MRGASRRPFEKYQKTSTHFLTVTRNKNLRPRRLVERLDHLNRQRLPPRPVLKVLRGGIHRPPVHEHRPVLPNTHSRTIRQTEPNRNRPRNKSMLVALKPVDAVDDASLHPLLHAVREEHERLERRAQLILQVQAQRHRPVRLGEVER